MRGVFGIENLLLEDHIDKVVIVVVLLSILPIIYEYLKARREKKAEAAAMAIEPEA
jgi:membrane-associated protein